MKMDNMRYYEEGRSVPQEALKSFSNGRFSGTDINPMWRIKKLTEMFGPAGIGWYTEVLRQEVVPVDDGNLMVFVDINLYVREGDEWSKPIFGTGGNTLKTKGRGDDDGFKKAYTDALSIACKALGIGADVWYQNDTTSKYADKYTDDQQSGGSPESAHDVGQRKLKEIEDRLKNVKNSQTPSDALKGPVQPAKRSDDQSVAQGAKAAQNGAQRVSGPSSKQRATDEQKKWIIDHASDEQYQDIMQRFGAELENLTANQAAIEITAIEKANDMTVRCERCDKAITGVALPDGTLMSGSDLVAKSKLTYGGVYCYSCMTELAKQKKARKAG